MKLLSQRKKGIIALILLSFVTASMGLFARSLSESFLVFQQVYVRVGVAFLLSLIIFHKDLDFSKLKKISRKEWGLLIFRSIALYIVGVALFTQAIITAKYSNVMFIEAIPLVAVFGMLFFKEKLTKAKFFFLSVAFIGVLLVGLKDVSNLLSWGMGEIMMLISAVGFSLAFVFRKYHSDLLNNKEITIIIFFISAILLFLTSLFVGEGLPTVHWSPWLILVALGAGFANVVYLFLSNYGFQKVDAILSSNLIMLEVPFGVLIALLVYAEVPTLRELLGGILIVSSVIGMNLLERKNR